MLGFSAISTRAISAIKAAVAAGPSVFGWIPEPKKRKKKKVPSVMDAVSDVIRRRDIMREDEELIMYFTEKW